MSSALVARKKNLPPIYQWIKDNKFNRTSAKTAAATGKSRDSRPCTHTFLDGPVAGLGSASIPNDRLEEFYRRYAADLLAKRSLYISEDAGPEPFKANFDFDMLFDEFKYDPNTLPSLESFFSEIQDAVGSQFCTATENRLIVTSCGLGSKRKDGRNFTKLGLHLCWSRLALTHPQLFMMRRFLINVCESRFGNAVPIDLHHSARLVNGWRDVIDLNVVKHPRCRMFGSRKLEECKCNGGQSAKAYRAATKGPAATAAARLAECPHQCTHFNSACLVDVGRVYQVHSVWSGTTIEHHEFDTRNAIDLARLLTETSLRTAIAEPVELELPDDYLASADSDDSVSAAAGPKSDQFAALEASVERSIRDYLDIHFRPLISDGITSVVYQVRPSKRVIVSLQNRFCFNKGGEHNSLTTYFVFQPFLLSFHCRCSCAPERIVSSCSNFALRHPLSPLITRRIFGIDRAPRPQHHEDDVRQLARESALPSSNKIQDFAIVRAPSQWDRAIKQRLEQMSAAGLESRSLKEAKSKPAADQSAAGDEENVDPNSGSSRPKPKARPKRTNANRGLSVRHNNLNSESTNKRRRI